MTFRVRPRFTRGPLLSSPRSRRTTSRLLVAALIIAANLFVAGIASAQLGGGASITIFQETSLPRVDKDGKDIKKRPLTLNPEGVNLQDCVDDQQIRFTLQMTGFEANGSVQRWASNSGAECKDPLTRSGGTQVCWQLGGNLPLQQTVTSDIPVRKIMSGAPPLSAQRTDDSEKICGQIDLTTISVHFLYFAPGNTATAVSAKTVGIIIDTVGPDPPTGLTVLPGNTRITVKWNSISGGGDSGTGGGLTALTGVKVYCDPASAEVPVTTQEPPICIDVATDAGASDAGDAAAGTTTVCDDGGTSTTTATAECASANFVNPDGSKLFPTTDFNAKYECGSITGNSGTTVVATSIGPNPLVNGTRYAVAVAGTDAYGNVGSLSSVTCETPAVTTDFWDDYTRAGGRAGGCAAGGAELPLGSLSVLALVMALSLSIARRGRRGTRS